MPYISGGGGGGGTVTGVTAADTSIVIGGTAAAPTVATGTLDVIATDHAPAAAVALNSQKITGLANGTAATDAAAFGQLPSADVFMPWLVPILPFAWIESVGTWAPSQDSALYLAVSTTNSATKAQNDEISWDVTLAAGTWTLDFYYTQSAAGGIATITLGAISVGTVDTYNASTVKNVHTAITAIAVGTTQKYRLKFKMATKNASSTAFQLNYIHSTLLRTA